MDRAEPLKRICIDCDRWFNLYRHEAQFFRDRGLSVPARCPSCRALRRQVRETTNAEPQARLRQE